jgi:hypothetical protein
MAEYLNDSRAVSAFGAHPASIFADGAAMSQLSI